MLTVNRPFLKSVHFFSKPTLILLSSLCSPGLLRTHGKPPASVAPVLILQSLSMPSLNCAFLAGGKWFQWKTCEAVYSHVCTYEEIQNKFIVREKKKGMFYLEY